MEIERKPVYVAQLRISEFSTRVIKYIGNTPIVVYEAKEPAEIYTIPNYSWKANQ